MFIGFCNGLDLTAQIVVTGARSVNFIVKMNRLNLSWSPVNWETQAFNINFHQRKWAVLVNGCSFPDMPLQFPVRPKGFPVTFLGNCRVKPLI